MKRFEMKRAFDSWNFKLALLIMSAIGTTQGFVNNWDVYKDPLKYCDSTNLMPMPPHLLIRWIGYYSPYYKPLLWLIPILATFAYGVSFCTDYNSGYLRNIFMARKRVEYLKAKYLAVFVSGGIIGASPLVVNLLVNACLVPAIKPVFGSSIAPHRETFLIDFYYDHPILYVLIYLLITFLYSGAFSTIALCGAFIIDNRFILSVVPFLLWYVLGFVPQLSPAILIRCGAVRVNPLVFLFEWVLIAGITYMIFLKKGKKMDV